MASSSRHSLDTLTPTPRYSRDIMLRLRRGKRGLLQSEKFHQFVQKSRNFACPSSPKSMFDLYKLEHVTFLKDVIYSRFDPKMKELVMTVKQYMECWIRYPLYGMIDFFASLIAYNIRISDKCWNDQNSSNVVVARYESALNMNNAPNVIMATDAAFVDRGTDVYAAGGVVIIGKSVIMGESNRKLFKCGKLPKMGRPRTENKMMIYELAALFKGLEFKLANLNRTGEQILEVCVDNLDLVKVLSGAHSILEDENYSRFISVIWILRKHKHYKVRHIMREQNMVADMLATFARRDRRFQSHDWDVRWDRLKICVFEHIRDALEVDELFNSYIRFSDVYVE